eukprot:TRINITY_DN2937_c0_g2_i1.p1 TRINITY_DN2937_c0_g2~~TRINITY_DN2937_c0_g2_i1.p1  ORF type:complete len:238 (-),score=42.42 TRINITY_DN2937_c0_g2_i1:67-780(-)
MANGFELMQEQNARLKRQLSEKEDANTKLLSARIRAESGQRILQKEMKENEKELETELEKYRVLAKELANIRAKISSYEEQLDNSGDQIIGLNSAVQVQNEKCVSCSKEVLVRRMMLDHTNRLLAEFGRKMESVQDILGKQQKKCSELKHEYDSAQKECARLESNGADQMLRQEVANLQRLLRCPVCHDRNKNFVLSRCFHVFCEACLKTNLSTRHRKCPQCQRSFGEHDVNRFYYN